MAAIGERLASLDERLAQSSRRERRSMAALDTLLQGQDRLLGLLRGDPDAQLGAVMDFGEALTVFIWPLAMSPDSKDARIVASKLLGLLKAFNLKITGLPGEKFDPALHKAVHAESVPSLEEGLVIQTVRPGFLSDQRVLRYASVVVNRKPSALSGAEGPSEGPEGSSAGSREPSEPPEIHEADGYEIAEPASGHQGRSEIHEADGYEIVEREGESAAAEDDEPPIPSASFEHLLAESNLSGFGDGPAGSSGRQSCVPPAQIPPPGHAGLGSEAPLPSEAGEPADPIEAEASQAEEGEAAEHARELLDSPEIHQADGYETAEPASDLQGPSEIHQADGYEIAEPASDLQGPSEIHQADGREIAEPAGETRISPDNEPSTPSGSFEPLLAESRPPSANHEESLADISAGSSDQEPGADLPDPPPPVQAGPVSEASGASEPQGPGEAVSEAIEASEDQEAPEPFLAEAGGAEAGVSAEPGIEGAARGGDGPSGGAQGGQEPSEAGGGSEKRADGPQGPVKAKGFLGYWS
jgi:hypothetical protein